MNFFRHEASLFASFFYVVNKFSYDDIFIEKIYEYTLL